MQELFFLLQSINPTVAAEGSKPCDMTISDPRVALTNLLAMLLLYHPDSQGATVCFSSLPHPTLSIASRGHPSTKLEECLMDYIQLLRQAFDPTTRNSTTAGRLLANLFIAGLGSGSASSRSLTDVLDALGVFGADDTSSRHSEGVNLDMEEWHTAFCYLLEYTQKARPQRQLQPNIPPVQAQQLWGWAKKHLHTPRRIRQIIKDLSESHFIGREPDYKDSLHEIEPTLQSDGLAYLTMLQDGLYEVVRWIKVLIEMPMDEFIDLGAGLAKLEPEWVTSPQASMETQINKEHLKAWLSTTALSPVQLPGALAGVIDELLGGESTPPAWTSYCDSAEVHLDVVLLSYILKTTPPIEKNTSHIFRYIFSTSPPCIVCDTCFNHLRDVYYISRLSVSNPWRNSLCRPPAIVTPAVDRRLTDWLAEEIRKQICKKTLQGKGVREDVKTLFAELKEERKPNISSQQIPCTLTLLHRKIEVRALALASQSHKPRIRKIYGTQMSYHSKSCLLSSEMSSCNYNTNE